MERIEDRTFDELKLGDATRLVRTLTQQDVTLAAVLSGDISPAHLDQACAQSDMFHQVVAHGMWGASRISFVVGAGSADVALLLARRGMGIKR